MAEPNEDSGGYFVPRRMAEEFMLRTQYDGVVFIDEVLWSNTLKGACVKLRLAVRAFRWTLADVIRGKL